MMTHDEQTKITFFGTSGAVPEVGGDSPTFLINDKYLVDTGWSVIDNLRSSGHDPLQLEYLIFTHFHNDHYMSLPSLLFYYLMRGRPLEELKIIGPAEDLQLIVRRAIDFLHAERYGWANLSPVLIPLTPGEAYEEENFRLDTCSTAHPVQGLCYRFLDKKSGRLFSFTGDTAFHPPIIEHVRGSALLIHESALGPIAANPDKNDYMHSGAIDAATIAEEAKVGKLLLLHGSAQIAEPCVQAAKQIFSGEVEWPKDGQTYII